jgi:hypothetical protein
MLLAKALAYTGDWHERNVTGEINAIERHHVRRVFPFANLSPQITDAILTARQPPSLTVKRILDSVPMGWQQQAAN